MLSDVLVLDLSRVLAGPYCTLLLADLGATVIKVESPAGDDTRRWGPPFVGPEDAPESGYFVSVNRSKKSVVLDLKTPAGRRAAQALAARCDVLVENFKTGDLDRYGLDYPSVAAANPGVVYASITGFGHTGPRAYEPGYDAALQAATGLTAMTGTPESGPVKLGVAWIDVLTGVHAAYGIVAALLERARTGRGRQLDLALFDTALASLVNQAQAALLTGEAPARLGTAHPSIVPYQGFEASDGALVIAVGNDVQFARLCEVLGLPELAADPRFSTNADRVAHRDALLPRLQAALSEETRSSWLERLGAAGVPATAVVTLPEALADPQLTARGMLHRVDHPSAGPLPLLGSPFGDAARPPEPPPRLGEHTRQVLTELLGWSDAEAEALIVGGDPEHRE